MRIEIERLKIHCRHGVLPIEQSVGQDFEVSLALDLDYDGADSLDSTINYAEVCALVTEQMQQPSALIEHAATRIARALRQAFPRLRGGSVTVAKLAPPMPYEVTRVSVTLPL